MSGTRYGLLAALAALVVLSCARTSRSQRAGTATANATAAGAGVGGGPASGPPVAADGARGVPRIDAALKARLRAVHARGHAHGMRDETFAKLGDSITESQSFLSDIGHGWFDLGDNDELAPLVAYYRRTRVDGDGNDSFAHASLAATQGWTAADALDGSPSAVARELDATRPAVALIMFGTNDVDRSEPDEFSRNLTRVVDLCLDRGVVPVLSTIPRRLDQRAAGERVSDYNHRIAAVATTRSIPLMDLYAVLEPLPRHGLSDDGVHPSAFDDHGDTQAAALTSAGLRYGYNARNLLALRTLAKVRAVVLEDGAPDR